MKVYNLKNSFQDDEQIVYEVADILKNRGVIIFPTDTIYGIGAKATDEDAVLKVYKVKQRSLDKPLSVLVKDMKMARRVACIDSYTEKILSNLWPGPITVILRKKELMPYILTAGTEQVALRIVDNYFVNNLFNLIDFPITATSANLSGCEVGCDTMQIQKEFSETLFKPNAFVNDGDLKNSTPSTIIDLTDSKNPKIVRMGIVSREEFITLFNQIVL